MTSEMTIQFNRDVLGVEVTGKPFNVTREHILRSCQATGETNPLFTDEEAARSGPYGDIIAPPDYYTRIPGAQPPDPEVKFGTFTTAGGRSAEFLEPIFPGDVVTPYASVEEVFGKTGRSGMMVFVTRRTTFKNQHGRSVLIEQHTTIHCEVSG